MGRVLLIGASGTIGAAVAEALSSSHEVLSAGRTADVPVDLGDAASIRQMFERVEMVDAVVSTAGAAAFGTLDQLTDEDYALSVNNKLLGQINLVRFGRKHVREDGSFTLTSGILAEHPNPGSTMLSAVNAGLNGFVGSAAMQLGKQRVNVVSPPLVKETAEKLGWGPGGMPAAQVAELYRRAVDGTDSGKIMRAG